MNAHKMNIESVIDFVTNGDASDLSELSSDKESEHVIQMVTNVQDEQGSESSDDEVNIPLSEVTNISSISTTEAAKIGS